MSFGGESDSRFLMKCVAFAHGLPAMIVSISAGSRPDLYGPQTASDPQVCVVRGSAFYFGLVLPIALALLGNFVVLSLVIKSLANKSMKNSLIYLLR